MEHNRTIQCQLTLTRDNPIVDDHRVYGIRTLPGVTFLDIIYRILDARGFALDRTELRNVLFVEPVVTTEEFDREIRVDLEWRSSSYRVLALSRKVRQGQPLGNEWSRHLEADLRIDSPFPSCALPLEELDRTRKAESDVEQVYVLGRAADIKHRAFMKCSGLIHHREGGLLAEIELGPEARESGEDFLLHPALMDASTMQSYALAFSGADGDPRPLIPIYVSSFRANGPLGDACLVNLRERAGATGAGDVLHVDIDLHDRRGRLVARFEKLSLKRVRSRELITRLTRFEARPDEDLREGIVPSDAGSAVPEPSATGRVETVRREVVRIIRELLGDDDIAVDPELGFYDLGLESTHLLRLVRALEERWGIALYPTLLFEYTTVESVAAYLADRLEADGPDQDDLGHSDDVGRTLCLSGSWERGPDLPSAIGADGVGSLLLFGSDTDLLERLRRLAEPAFGGATVVLARLGTAYREVETGIYELRSDSGEDYERLLADLARQGLLPDSVVHLGPTNPPRRATELPASVEATCESLVLLSQALLAVPGRDCLPILHVSVAATGALSDSSQGALVGLAKTIRLEQPRVRLKVVELGAPTEPEDFAIRLRDVVPRELRDDGEAWVRYEGMRRYVRRYREVAIGGVQEEAGPPRLRERGVYLISGGGGALGRLFAAWLSRTVRARLVLFGRSELDEAGRAELRAMEARGAEVRYVRADVADLSDVERVVRETKAHYGEIHGVIHAAGLLRDSLVPNKTVDDVRQVLAPKLRGAVNLDEATKYEDLDFFALFSSVTGAVGNAGQADYAVGNAFLNAYARSREAWRSSGRRQGRTLSLGWPLWSAGGMRTDTSTEAYFRRQGQVPMPEETGIEIFLAALGQPEPELILFHGDRQRILNSLDPATPGAAFDLPLTGDALSPAPPVGEVRPAESSEDIAIIGLAGRYPMAENLEQLWENLVTERDCVTEISTDRWSQEEFIDPKRTTPGHTRGRWGGFMKDVDRFDPQFFQITPREAESMDPQERIFLETVWHAMEDAGCSRAGLADSRVGVFVGVMFNQYQMLGLQAPPGSVPMLPTSFSSSVANRVSYFFDFHGPSLALDTMCSSSITAIHLACQSLRSGDCEVAFAGGVNVSVHPYKYLYLGQAGFLSSDGRCRSFGTGGDGYVPGEGVGAVLLKPLERALADGDRIQGVIKGSAVNHGGRAGGYTVPSPAAQTSLVSEALERADVDPRTISYLEAHGTGTALGDPIEMAALERAFGPLEAGRERCPIGSIKSNLGHLEPAAGIAGLTKVLLQMRHRKLVPSLHASPPNPEIDWETSPFRVQRKLSPWPQPASSEDSGEGAPPRRAGISAFGAGGANGHVVVEDFPATKTRAHAPPGPYLVLLSARKEENLRQLAERYLDFLDAATPSGTTADRVENRFKPEMVAALCRVGAELFGLSESALDPTMHLDEWGLDASDLRHFEQQIAERFQTDGPVPHLDMGTRLEDVADRLLTAVQTSTPSPAVDAGEQPSLSDIAYTTQIGREAMYERLALVVASPDELRDGLRRFAREGLIGAHAYRGSAKQVGGEVAAGGAIDTALSRRDLDLLARLWVGGGKVEWSRLHEGDSPRKVGLPLYPFTRRRCWVDGNYGWHKEVASDGQSLPEPEPEPEPEPDVGEFLFTPGWRPAPTTTGRGAPDGPALIFHTATGRPLAEALVERHVGQEVTMIELSSRTRGIGTGRWEIDAADPSALANLRPELSRPRTIYFLGGLLDALHTGGIDEPALLERQEQVGVLSLLRCVTQLAIPAAGSEQLTLKIVGNDIWSVEGGSGLNPYAAGLAGFARVLESEHPHWSAVMIDVGLDGALPEVGNPRWDQVADRIVDEPNVRGARVAYRGGARYQEVLYSVSLPLGTGRQIRTGGVYAIVGGAGGIGLEIARFLANEHQARVALLGRSPLDDERRRRIAEADPDGSHLTYIQADAGNVESLRGALDQIHLRFGPVQGVIHSALVQKDRLVRNLGESDMRESLAAKSGVGAALSEVFGHEPLDFLLLFSSVQTFLGDAGLASYAAGSSFLDAYAHSLNDWMPFPVRVINWGYWGTVGTVATDRYRDRLTQEGFRCITPQAGWETALRALQGDLVQVVVMPATTSLLGRMGLDQDTGWVSEEVPHPSPTLLQRRQLLGDAELAAVTDFHALDEMMGRLASVQLVRILNQMGAWHEPSEVLDEETLGRRIGVVPRYEQLLGKLLRILCEAGLVQERLGGYALTTGILEGYRADGQDDELNVLAEQHSKLAVFVRLLSLCLSRYPELLRGQLLATDLLFPNSGTSLMEGLYKGNPISDVYNEVLNKSVLAYVKERLPGLAEGESIRVLEVGSGTGGTSVGLLRALEGYADRLEYYYTDLSVAFLEHGKREYGAGYPFVRFKRLDLDREIEDQGFEPGSFDLVIASNVVHATRDIRRTLRHIKTALRADGWVLLNELTTATVQATVTYGLFDGWWSHDDSDRRLPGSPLLDVNGWREAMAELGYRSFVSLPGDDQPAQNFQHVIVAQSDGAAPKPQARPISWAQEIEPAAPEAPPAAVAEIDERSLLTLFEQDILELTASTSGIALEDLDPDLELSVFGFDSISYSLLAERLNDRYGFDLTPTIFYETASLRALIEKLACDYPSVLSEHYRPEPPTTSPMGMQSPRPTPVASGAEPKPTVMPPRVALGATKEEPLAIIGMAGLLPGSPDLEGFWQNLIAGADLITEVPGERWDWRSAHNEGDGTGAHVHGRWGGFIDGVELFDPLFFGISPREAEGMDPQQRLYLQTVWASLENAGISPGSLAGSDTGLFVGVGSNDYQELQQEAGLEIDAFGATANAHSILVNRISFLLDLHGPSEPVNTGCSSSLVALHRAVEAIRSGACELAVAGGVNLILSPRNYVLLSKTGMLSSDGRCKTFDAAANGFVRGEGMGAVVLTTRQRAEAAGHRVRAWLRGSAVNHGGRARSLTAPNPSSQARMLVQAYQRANIDPATVGYIEAHGTGTELGDPVEVSGLKSAFRDLFRARGTEAPDYAYCGLGAVKSNIGHLEPAAGIAGVLKVLLSMEHGVLPSSLHLRQPNPYLQLEGSPFYLVTERTPWRRMCDGQGREIPRRGGVSSFGYGGVNAHVVLEEASQPEPASDAGAAAVFVLSAKTETALREYAASLEAFLAREQEGSSQPALVDVAYTLQVGRDAMEHRMAVVARSRTELIEGLSHFIGGAHEKPVAGLYVGKAKEDISPPYRSLLDGEAGAGFLGSILKEGDLDRIAQLWVDGVEVGWKRLHAGQRPRLVSLPTYPFERRRYWIPVDGPTSSLQERARTEPAAASQTDSLEGMLYAPSWVPSPKFRPEPPASSGPTWLVYTEDGAALAEALASLLAPRQVLRVRCDRPGSMRLSPLPDPASIYFLDGANRAFDQLDVDQLAALADAEETGILALFRIVKHLLERPAAAGRLALTVVTSGACAIEGYPVRNPSAASLWGFAKSLRREYGAWNVATVDLDREDVSRDAVRAADEVLAASGLRDAEIAWCGGRRFRQILEPLTLPAASRDLLREGGVYVVVGGAGNVGSDVAAYLVERYGARLALVGRSPLDEAGRDRIAMIDPSGEHVIYLQADARDASQLRRVADVVTERFGRIRGVVNAANVLRDRSLYAVDEAWFREGIESKTRTSAAIVDVFGKEPLDFLLLFSSVQSFLGNPGQSSYASASVFQDAYAHYLAASLPYPVRVIDWGAWGEEGLAARYRDRLEEAGVASIPPARALGAMVRILGEGAVQAAVVSGTPEFLAGLGVEELDRRDEYRASPSPEAGGAVAEPKNLGWERWLREDVHALVCEAAKVGAEEMDADAELSQFGFDSIAYTQLSNRCNETYDLDLTPAFFFGISTTNDLIEKLASVHTERLRRHYQPRTSALTTPDDGQPEPEPPVTAGLPDSSLQAPPATTVLADAVKPSSTPSENRNRAGEGVAVVGMAGILPQSDNLAEFWTHLMDGDDLITEIPPDRWDWRQIYGDPEQGGFKTRVKWGGFMRRVDLFDPLFFGISPKEAEAMDPQHRLFLEAVWSCIEDAGIRPSSLAGTDTGVFLGASTFDYFEVQHAFGVALEGYNSLGRSHSVMANRVSFLLDLHGSSETIDTACSSSLVAVHRAVESIEHGDCELAIAGGVNVITSPTLFVDLSRADMLSPDGRCKAFDARADGFVRAEGVGAILLKRLSAAVADGDIIYGVIRGSAVNHGGRTNSLTAPNPDAQAAAVVKAHERAGIDPRTVTYIETHGTGTSLGDPVEIDGLKSAFATLYRRWGVDACADAHCALGAVKSNVGHLEAGAGIAGLLKVLLAMRHATLPKNLHIEDVNPYIRLAGGPFRIPRERQDWDRRQDQRGQTVPRRAGVSSFGVGGVNAHVVIEEYTDNVAPTSDEGRHGIFVLSAKNGERLRAYAADIVSWLEQEPASVSLASLTYTLQTGREQMEERLAILAEDLDDLQRKLSLWVRGGLEVGGTFSGNSREHGVGSDVLLKGTEEREYLHTILAERKLEKLARLWVSGTSIDWKMLYPYGTPRRIPMPTYPFARERYWPRPGEQFDERQVVEARLFAEAEVEAPQAHSEPLAADAEDVVEQLERRITTLLAQHLGVNQGSLRPDRNLVEYGVDSLGLKRLRRGLSTQLEMEIPTNFFSSVSSVRDLAHKLLKELSANTNGSQTRGTGDGEAPQTADSGPKDRFQAIAQELQEGRIGVDEALRELTNGTIQ